MKCTNDQIIEAVKQSAGFITTASQMLGITYQGLWKRINKSKKLMAIIDEIQETRLDLSESKLMEAIEHGEAWAICFHLKCKGKKRGYIERQEITGKDGKFLIPDQNAMDERAKKALAEMLAMLAEEDDDKSD